MQTLSDLITKPTTGERAAFAALTGDHPSFTKSELKLIRDALHSHAQLMSESAENFSQISSDAHGRNVSIARKFRVLANEQTIAACDARELADKIAKAVRV